MRKVNFDLKKLRQDNQMENNYFGDNVDSKSQIYEIYADNLESSFVDLRKAAEKYNYVAMVIRIYIV